MTKEWKRVILLIKRKQKCLNQAVLFAIINMSNRKVVGLKIGCH